MRIEKKERLTLKNVIDTLKLYGFTTEFPSLKNSNDIDDFFAITHDYRCSNIHRTHGRVFQYNGYLITAGIDAGMSSYIVSLAGKFNLTHKNGTECLVYFLSSSLGAKKKTLKIVILSPEKSKVRMSYTLELHNSTVHSIHCILKQHDIFKRVYNMLEEGISLDEIKTLLNV